MAAGNVQSDQGFQMKRILQTILILVLTAATLAACGRRGPLEAPSAAANPETGEKTEAAPVEDKPFVLDGLIQ